MLFLFLACAAEEASTKGDTLDTSTEAVDTSAPTDTGEPEAWPVPGGEVMVHLFEWRWDDIADECEQFLGPAGFGAVQVSPPQEHAQIDGAPWWERYQPVSYQLYSRSGGPDDFADMVHRCRAAGVEIYVDAVINHTAWLSGTGTAGTEYTDYNFPGLYTSENFHDCRRGIEDWGSRDEIQNCELATLPDLATEQAHVQEQLTGYLQSLVDLGVTGFRVDAAKHIPAADLSAIFSGVHGAPFVFQEVLSLDAGDVIQPNEYYGIGRVTELKYGMEISRVFREDQLTWLSGFGELWGLQPSGDVVVFIDNHDNQRGHGAGDPLTHKDSGLYTVANVYMLAWPYGRPKLMSSYAFTDTEAGPPQENGETQHAHDADGQCRAAWVCEHRWDAIAGMVGFRNAAEDAPVENWWSNGNDQIAFSRGDRAFLVLNREEAPTLTQTFQTGLPAGDYCDVIAGRMKGKACAGETITVGADGTATITVPPPDAVALHIHATPGS